jgi:hypothetical protein
MGGKKIGVCQLAPSGNETQEKKQSVRVIWRQAEMKHREKKIGECYLAPSGNYTREGKNR